MHRVLITSPICAFLILLAGCHTKPFRTDITNGSSETINLAIYSVDPSRLISHGDLEAGNSLLLFDTVDAIDYINYQIGSHQCRIEKTQIAKVIQPEVRGRRRLTLYDCRDSVPIR